MSGARVASESQVAHFGRAVVVIGRERREPPCLRFAGVLLALEREQDAVAAHILMMVGGNAWVPSVPVSSWSAARMSCSR
jgi:hypothetical protein